MSSAVNVVSVLPAFESTSMTVLLSSFCVAELDPLPLCYYRYHRYRRYSLVVQWLFRYLQCSRQHLFLNPLYKPILFYRLVVLHNRPLKFWELTIYFVHPAT